MENLPKQVFQNFARQLRPCGFRTKLTKNRLYRQRAGCSHVFHFAVVNYTHEYRLRPSIAVRFDTVEKIFHRTSGFAQANHDTSTIGVDLANARGWEGYRLELRSEADIPGLVERLMEVFHTDAEPYYAKYSDLEAVDRSLNDRPRERTVHSMIPWMRCAKGIVIANLLERTDYEELVSIYRETLRHDAKGFYLPWFEALVKDLEMLNRATHRRHD